MKNKYEIKGDKTYICLGKSEHIQEVTIIDTEDLEKFINLEKYITRQFEHKTNSYYAIVRLTVNGKPQNVLLHRMITNAKNGYSVDHINHNTLDNRKSNLRICTNSQNHQNRKGAQKNSKSGIRGVYWDKRKQKWGAQLEIMGNCVFSRSFDSISEAERAVKEARAKYMPYSQEALAK